MQANSFAGRKLCFAGKQLCRQIALIGGVWGDSPWVLLVVGVLGKPNFIIGGGFVKGKSGLVFAEVVVL